METGVAKSVSSSRKHERVADFARSLRATWKQLVLVSREAARTTYLIGKHKDLDSKRRNRERAKLSLETSKRKRKFSHVWQNPVGFSCNLEEEEEVEESEPPTMTFEEYLTYDQPQKKKKKVVKRSVPAGEEDRGHGKEKTPKAFTNSSSSSGKSPSRKRTTEERAEKEPPEAPKPKRILLDVVPTLPDTPPPPVQASYSPLPELDEPIPCPPSKRKALSFSVEESEDGFGGQRRYSRTPVYSGRKPGSVPKTMAASQQSVRGLGNNTDSICEEAAVPFAVLEPALERCTPEQLSRIEECSHVLIEHTDQLWQKHCLREFKNERPGESESWRQMYMRLQNTKEQRLLTLARKINSAHANIAKGRVAQIVSVDSALKAPWDVRRRQESMKPVLCSSSQSHTGASEEQCGEGPSTSSACSLPSSGTASSSSHNPKKPPVKKIAPLMAKSIKDFKKRLSR